ncbi:Flotillin family [Trema orientale]|uniref:Flotillin-like n=1 Tax=Trema orientale TaxID=63057 RepID=A0A2P5FCA6_TREOI|nr:Flotillin family [Trema orientale]
MNMYHVAGPNEYLAIRGLGIKDMKLCKKAYVLPLFQKCTHIYIAPVTCAFRVEAKSVENLPFIMTASFEMCPRADDKTMLLLYAKLVCPYKKLSIPNCPAYNRVYMIVEREIRAIASSVTMEKFFKDSKVFKENVVYNIQLQLNQFGLVIYNAIFEQDLDVHKTGIENSSLASKKDESKRANDCDKKIKSTSTSNKNKKHKAVYFPDDESDDDIMYLGFIGGIAI